MKTLVGHDGAGAYSLLFQCIVTVLYVLILLDTLHMRSREERRISNHGG
jgi:hypothetical protein